MAYEPDGLTDFDRKDLARAKRSVIAGLTPYDLKQFGLPMRIPRPAVGAPDGGLSDSGGPSNTSGRSMIPAGTATAAPAYGMSGSSSIPDGTPDIPTHAPTPDELRLIHRQQINNAQQADVAARAARADEYRRTGSVVSLDPSVLAMRQHADQQAELAHRFGMTFQPRQTPEQVAANRADLTKQFAANTTGPDASRIAAPPSAFNDVSKFFGVEGQDIYQGAGDAAMRMIHSKNNISDLNRVQNRPRDLTFAPYAPHVPDSTDAATEATMHRMVMAHRAREALGRHVAANDMENIGNESDAGVQTGRTNLILARGGTTNAPDAVAAEGSGLRASDAENKAKTAESGVRGSLAGPMGKIALARAEKELARVEAGPTVDKASIDAARAAAGVDEGFMSRMSDVVKRLSNVDGTENATEAQSLHDILGSGISQLELMASTPSGAVDAKNTAATLLASLKLPAPGIYGLNPIRTLNVNEHRDKLRAILPRLQKLAGLPATNP